MARQVAGVELGCEPMLARAETTLPGERALPGGTVYQPKWDGFRGLVFRDQDQAWVFSRQGKDLTACFPDIAAAVVEQVPPGTVLDGELVVWGGAALDFTALQRRLLSPGRCAEYAARSPATYMAFDALAAADDDVRGRSHAARRRLLENLAAAWSPPLQLTPQTDEVAVARAWLAQHAAAGVGIEGVVAKGAASRYTGGKRGWVKVRYRRTAEAVVGAVIGPVGSPRRLVLGLLDDTGALRVAGATHVLTDRQAAAVGALLSPAGERHPWPRVLPAGWLGRYAKERVATTRVDPLLVVEVEVDTAFEHGRWRHLTRFVRARRDLAATDVTGPRPTAHA